MASVTVDVDIDEFDDGEVVLETLRRGYRVTITPEQMQKKFDKWDREQIQEAKADLAEEHLAEDDLAELLRCLRQQRYADAISMVESMLFPKFKTLTECETAYKKLKAAAR